MNAMGWMKAAAVLAAVAAAGPGWAINKCTMADGRVQFQDAPCAGRGEQITVKPAAGDAPQTPAAAPPPGAATQRMTQQLNVMVAERRLRELETERDNYNASCDQAMNALQTKKGRANNNLAGATWEQSISTEMNAVARRCEARNTTINTNVENARKECLALGGCK